jgi:hypothetical protein
MAWELTEVLLGVTHEAYTFAALLLLWWSGLGFAECCCLLSRPLHGVGGSHDSGGMCNRKERTEVNELRDRRVE